MNSVLITGGTGFLGSKIVEYFLANNCRVVVLARKNSSLSRIENHLKNQNCLVEYVGNKNVEIILKDYSINGIIHTATCYARNNEAWSEIVEANLLLPLNLMVKGELAGVDCFINADTFFHEKMGFKYNESLYVKTKKIFLQIAKDGIGYAKTSFFNMRIEQMYGPADDHKKFIPFIINELLNNPNQIPLTNGVQKRDLIFVDDVAKAFFNAFKHRNDLSSFEEFGIGSGSSISIREIVELLKVYSASKSELEFGKLPYRDNEIMDTRANISNNNKINWKSEIDWREGLSQTVGFYKNTL